MKDYLEKFFDDGSDNDDDNESETSEINKVKPLKNIIIKKEKNKLLKNIIIKKEIEIEIPSNIKKIQIKEIISIIKNL